MMKERIELFMKLIPGTVRIEIQKFIQYFSETSYVRNQMIWEEGDEVESFSLIKKGSVELWKDLGKRRRLIVRKEEFIISVIGSE